MDEGRSLMKREKRRRDCSLESGGTDFSEVLPSCAVMCARGELRKSKRVGAWAGRVDLGIQGS